jgi:hypothetical protein
VLPGSKPPLYSGLGGGATASILLADWAWCLLVRSVDYQLGTSRGRYDEHNSKFFLGKKSRFNRPVGERNHF